MEKTLPGLFNEAYADAVAALGHRFPLPPQEQICVLYNQRIGRAWGNACAYHSGIYRRMIKLSVDLCQHTNQNSILNTMVHELIHCCGIWNHRRDFKIAAALINRMFPEKYDISRCTSAQSKMTEEQMDQTYKYIVSCPKCHTKWGFKRFSKVVQNAERCWCPKCSHGKDKVHTVRIK